MTIKPPKGRRFLQVDEVIEKGDMQFHAHVHSPDEVHTMFCYVGSECIGCVRGDRIIARKVSE